MLASEDSTINLPAIQCLHQYLKLSLGSAGQPRNRVHEKKNWRKNWPWTEGAIDLQGLPRMGETTPTTSALPDRQPQKQYEQPQSAIYPIRRQSYNFQLLHKEFSQISSCQRHFTEPKQPQGAPLSKSEDVQCVVDRVELPCQTSRLTKNASPYSLPTIIAPNIQLHLPVDSFNHPSPHSNLSTGMPTISHVSSQNQQGPSHVVVDGVGIEPQWSAEHPSMFSCWYDQSQLRLSSPFQPSDWQPHHTRPHPTGAPLVQHPQCHYNYWYPPYPLVNISQSTFETQHNNAALTSSDGVSPRVWSVRSPMYPISAPNFGPVQSPRVPLPTTSTSDTLSALLSSPRGSNGSSVNNSFALQLSADCAFGPVRQEAHETTHCQEQPSRGSRLLVSQNIPMQPLFREFVPRDQQFGAPQTEGDQWGGRTKHPGHFCLVEKDIPTLGQSKGSALCTTSDQSTGSCLEESPRNTPPDVKCHVWINGPVNCTLPTLGRPDLSLGASSHLVVLCSHLNACSASSPGLTCAPVNQEYIWNSLETGQRSRQTKTPGIPTISGDVSPLPSGGQDTLPLLARGRNTVQGHSGKGHWGIADDRLLIKLVNTYGTRRWSLIATFMSSEWQKDAYLLSSAC